MRRIPVLLALLALATPAGAAVVEAGRRGTRLRLATAAAAAEVDLARYRLRVLLIAPLDSFASRWARPPIAASASILDLARQAPRSQSPTGSPDTGA